MNEWEIEDLAEDIRKNGLLEPIILFENEILDGRNRYLACKKANIEPTFRIFNFNIDPYDFVISENLKRRHLNSAQLTEVGFKMWPYERERAKERQDRTLPDLGEKGTKPISNVVPSELTTLENQLEGKSRDLVAKKLHISGKTLQQAKKIKEASKEDPEISKKWEDAKKGTRSIKSIYNEIRQKEKREEKLKEIKKDQPEHQKIEYKPLIYHQDYSDFLESIKDNSSDLLLTDPPYLTDIEDINIFVKSWVLEALNKIRDTGRIYIFTGPYPEEIKAYLDILLSQSRFILGNILIWTYRNTIGPSPENIYKNNWNAIFYLYGKDAPPLNTDSLIEKFTVKNINAPDGRQNNRFFKWQKPDELAEMLIRHSTQKNDSIIDPFAGSGTFLLKATEMKRFAKGCDNNKEAIKIAIERGCIIQ